MGKSNKLELLKEIAEKEVYEYYSNYSGQMPFWAIKEVAEGIIEIIKTSDDSKVSNYMGEGGIFINEDEVAKLCNQVGDEAWDIAHKSGAASFFEESVKSILLM